MTWDAVQEHLERSKVNCENHGVCAMDGEYCELEIITEELPYEPYETTLVRCLRCGIEACVDAEIDEPA